MPLYNRAEYLPLAIESILAQTLGDLGVVLLDDCSTDETASIAERLAGADDRVIFFRSAEHLGLISSWRRAYELALESFPRAEYFAWGSDHDIWDPRWLEALSRELDRVPEAVLAYPLSVRIDEHGDVMTKPWRFSIEGVARPSARLRRACWGMGGRAGSMVYGLFRRSALERVRVFPAVREPDSLLLAELSLLGEFRQVPEALWRRRFAEADTRRHQLATLFHGRPPWYVRLPTWLQHSGVVLRRHGPRVLLHFASVSAAETARRFLRNRFLAVRKRT